MIYLNMISRYGWLILIIKKKKYIPRKKRGSILICSKVIRDKTTKYDAVSRIFKMNGNAVICIFKEDDIYSFELIDALGNTWGNKTTNLKDLTKNIKDFYNWSCGQKRLSLQQKFVVENEFVKLNKELSIKVQNSIGSRYFGNASTRCMKLFPSERNNDVFLFSTWNSNKEFLTEEDFVIVDVNFNESIYSFFGAKKPSVDTPIQIELYKKLKNINYMIHGHAFIKNCVYTNDYYPCCDLREYNSIIECIEDYEVMNFEINLKNHGFLIGSNTINGIKTIINKIEIIQKEILIWN